MRTTVKFLKTGLLVLSLVCTSCSKDSVECPIGPTGPRGEQGVQGEKGYPVAVAKTTSRETVLSQLESHQVDINDYQAVCKYFDITVK